MTVIFVKNQEIEITEVIYGLWVEGNLFEILEIPFLSRDLNILDIVRCKPYLPKHVEGYYNFVEVVKSSGHQTFHVAFTQNTLLDEKKKIISDLSKMGVLYRRSGLSAFSFSISPGMEKDRAVEYINNLLNAKIIVKDNRKDFGTVSNVMSMLGYMFHPPKLNDGLSDDEELDYFPGQTVNMSGTGSKRQSLN